MLEVGLGAIITGRPQLAPLAYTRITTATREKREKGVGLINSAESVANQNPVKLTSFSLASEWIRGEEGKKKNIYIYI